MISHQKLQMVALSLIFAVAILTVALMWWPFLTVLAMSCILAVLFLPLYKKFAAKFKSEPLAAIATILVILLIVIIPLYLIGRLLFDELAALYGQYRTGDIAINKAQIFQNLSPQMRAVADNFFNDFGQRVTAFASHAFASVTQVLSNVAGFFLSFFLVFFTVYYLLRDGEKIKKYFSSIFPLSEEHGNLLIKKLEGSVSGVVKGAFLVALIQGVLATIGFLIFGVPSAFLWGAFTVLAALVPTVGTSIALIPAILYLLITGHVGAGIGLAVWGALAVGLIDNILSPKLVGRQTELHPLLVLFSILGGFQLFGFLGFLLGPIVMAIFVTLLNIYRTDLKEYLEK